MRQNDEKKSLASISSCASVITEIVNLFNTEIKKFSKVRIVGKLSNKNNFFEITDDNGGCSLGIMASGHNYANYPKGSPIDLEGKLSLNVRGNAIYINIEPESKTTIKSSDSDSSHPSSCASVIAEIVNLFNTEIEKFPKVRIVGNLSNKNNFFKITDDNGCSLGIMPSDHNYANYPEKAGQIDLKGKLSLNVRGNAIYINIKPEPCSIKTNEEQIFNLCDFEKIKNTIKDSNSSHIGTHFYPKEIKKVSIIVPMHKDSSVLTDIKSGHDFPDDFIEEKKVNISDPKEIAKAIQTSEGEIIIIARGGGADEQINVFNDHQIIQALDSCNKFRILAIGHTQDVPYSYLYADYKAITPTMAGTALAKIIEFSKTGCPAQGADRSSDGIVETSGPREAESTVRPNLNSTLVKAIFFLSGSVVGAWLSFLVQLL